MEENTITTAGLQLMDMCQRLIRQREMRNARTSQDYCFWMHPDTAADLIKEMTKHMRILPPEKGYALVAFGLPIYLDSKMEYGEISCVKRLAPNQ